VPPNLIHVIRLHVFPGLGFAAAEVFTEREHTLSWNRYFDQPLPLPSGSPARTLRDAANYIKTLPTSQRVRKEWRLAIHMLIDAADDRGPMLFARIGILRALESNTTRLPPLRRLAPSKRNRAYRAW
jgi:hypothetical protein